jgi:hemoglobin
VVQDVKQAHRKVRRSDTCGTLWQAGFVSRPSMFDFAGGDSAFLKLAAAHHERCLADPVLNHPFSHGVHPEHVERLASYWSEVFGGPPRYSQSWGGHSAMISIHAGTGADDELGDRFIECFVQAGDDAGLPDDPEFRQALRAYMTWAVGDVHAYSPRGSTVPEAMAVPRWSWDGLQ